MVRSRSSGSSTSRRSRRRPRKRPHKALDRSVIASLTRPEPSRNPRKAILIALEDQRSARLYFDGFRKELRGQRIVILVDWSGSDPKSVVRAAKEAREERKAQAEKDQDDPFDEVWVVFDTLDIMQQMGVFPKGPPPRPLMRLIVALQRLARRRRALPRAQSNPDFRKQGGTS